MNALLDKSIIDFIIYVVLSRKGIRHTMAGRTDSHDEG